MVIRFHVSLSISGICLRIPAPGKHYYLLCSQQQVSSIYPSYFMQGGCFYAFIIKIQSGKHLHN